MAYNTSDAYKLAIKQDTRTSKITGKITFSNNNELTLENEILSQGSVSLSNQCVSDNVFTLGSVYVGELDFTLKTELDRYLLFNAKVEMSYNLLLPSGIYEEVPLGVFYINEANRIGRNISIKSYDKMINLDKKILSTTTGVAFDLLLLISEKCDVELAQSEQEIKEFVNSSELLLVDESVIDTYRTLLSYICVTLCCFATIDRQGKLRLVKFASNFSKELIPQQRTSSMFSDFDSYHTKVNADFYADNQPKTYTSKADVDDGLTMELGEIPIVHGTDISNQNVLNNIFEVLKNIRYIPCDIKFPGDPSIDLGDMIKNFDRNNEEYTSYVTSYKWVYRGAHQIKCVGANPKLKVQSSKVNVNLGAIQSEIESKTLHTYTYTNAQDITQKGGEEGEYRTLKEVVRIPFVTKGDAVCTFHCTVFFELDIEGCVELQMNFEGAKYYVVKHHCNDGFNTISFSNFIPIEEAGQYRTNVYIRTFASEDGGSIPTAFIKKFNVKAMLTGQNMVAEIPWDGTIQYEAVIGGTYNFSSDFYIESNSFDAMLNITKPPFTPHSFVTENLNAEYQFNSEFKIEKPLVINFEFNETIYDYTLNTEKKNRTSYNKRYVKVDDVFILNHEYEAQSEEQDIDSGRMASLQIDNSLFASVEQVDITVT